MEWPSKVGRPQGISRGHPGVLDFDLFVGAP
jgi:hypothetical protein